MGEDGSIAMPDHEGDFFLSANNVDGKRGPLEINVKLNKTEHIVCIPATAQHPSIPAIDIQVEAFWNV